MLNDIFTNPAFWFWTLFIVQSALIIWFVEHGQVIGGAFCVLALIVGVAFFPSQWEAIGLGGLNDSSLWEWFTSNFWSIVAGIGIYLIMGLAWGTMRWWIFVKDMREEYDTHRHNWLTPAFLYGTSDALRARAECCLELTRQNVLMQWAEACRQAADAGGNMLTRELRPIWKDYVENGYRD
jgi:hypothetical protein